MRRLVVAVVDEATTKFAGLVSGELHTAGIAPTMASLVERDHKEVHRNLTELEALGVIEFEQAGRSKRPIVRFDEIEIDISVGLDDDDAIDRTAAV